MSQHSVVSCASSRHLDSARTLGREAGRSDPVGWCDHAVKFVILARVFRAGLGGDDRQRLARRNDFRTWRLEPTTRGRARNTLSNGVINLARRSDEIPKSMVISTLNPSRGYQDSIIVISARESNREDENSRKKLQNVVTVSTSLRYLNHTKAFWNQVDKVLPDYRDRKEWLRLNGAGMNL